MTPEQQTAADVHRIEDAHALANQIACRVVLDYGEGDSREQDAAKAGALWKDHPAFQTALAAIIETTERAATMCERHSGVAGTNPFSLAHSIRNQEHLK